ncbi:MAG: hypothetical protein JXA28_11640 [Bacteroidetes bacterium]|nr:hypothetical protein [Bacteroidota bacterium]
MSNLSSSPSAWRSIPFRLSMTFFVFGSLVWLGGIIYRALIANELFVAGTLDFDPAVLPAQESMLYQLIAASSVVVNIAYGVTLLSAIVVFRTIPLRLKDHGWLMMAAIFLFLFVPVELFTTWLDIKFIYLWEWTRDAVAEHGLEGFMDVRTELRKTISHRIGALSGLPVMGMFCYITAVMVIIWQPLRRDRVSTPDTANTNE